MIGIQKFPNYHQKGPFVALVICTDGIWITPVRDKRKARQSKLQLNRLRFQIQNNSFTLMRNTWVCSSVMDPALLLS